MIFAGQIFDETTKKPLPDATVSIIPYPAQEKYVPVVTIANSQGQFYINNDRIDWPNIAKITYIDYEPQTWQMDGEDWSNGKFYLKRDYQTEGEVIVKSSIKKNSSWFILLLAALLLTSKKKTVSGIDTGSVMAIGLGLVFIKGFGLFNDILSALGLGKDKDDTDVEAEQGDPLSPFNPNYFNNSNAAVGDKTQAVMYVQKIYPDIIDLFNEAWGYFSDDESKIFAAFQKFRNKLEVGVFSFYWHQNEGTDLLEWLKGEGGFWGWPKDRLDNEEINRIIKMIDKLPKV